VFISSLCADVVCADVVCVDVVCADVACADVACADVVCADVVCLPFVTWLERMVFMGTTMPMAKLREWSRQAWYSQA
jgi:hypothetical protein